MTTEPRWLGPPAQGRAIMSITERLQSAVRVAEQKGLSRAELARRVGMAHSGLSRFLSHGQISRKNQDALAQLLGMRLTGDEHRFINSVMRMVRETKRRRGRPATRPPA